MFHKSALTLLLATAALLAGCGKTPPMLTQDAVSQAAQACGAHLVFIPAQVKGEAPVVRVADRIGTLNGKRIDVPRCVSAKLSGYTYGRLVLDAGPADNAN